MPTVEQENEIERARALQRRRDVAHAFRSLFGTPPNLTLYGKVVLEALEATYGRGLPKNVLDDKGATDLWQTVRCLGQRDVLQTIHEALNWKESEHTHVNPSSSSPQ